MLAAGQAVEIDRKVQRDGHVTVGGEKYQVGAGHAGTRVTMRLDGHLTHAIAGGALAGTWPCPITAERAALRDVRYAIWRPPGRVSAAFSSITHFAQSSGVRKHARATQDTAIPFCPGA